MTAAAAQSKHVVMSFAADKPVHGPRKPRWWKDEGAMQLFSALLYAVVATSMSLINRFALLAFPLPTILLLAQMVATLGALYPLLLARVLDFPLFRWTRFCSLFGIAVLYTTNTAFALFGLKTLNLPMYTAIKRMTPMTILVIKSVWKRSWPQPKLVASVSLVFIGCIVAGLGDLTFDPWAYSFALCSVITQALYLLLVEVQGDAGASSTSELLWYNAITALPLLAGLTAVNGDFSKVAPAAAKGLASHGGPAFWALVIGAATIGTLLNYSMFLCTMYNSALTTTIVGVLRGVATVLLGFALDTVPYSSVNVAGIVLNTAGGVWYTYIKYSEKAASGSGNSQGSSSKAGRQRGPSYARLAGGGGSSSGSSDGGEEGRPLRRDGSRGFGGSSDGAVGRAGDSKDVV